MPPRVLQLRVVQDIEVFGAEHHFYPLSYIVHLLLYGYLEVYVVWSGEEVPWQPPIGGSRAAHQMCRVSKYWNSRQVPKDRLD